MATLPDDDLPPFGLTVLEGGKRDWRAEEAHVEIVTAFREQAHGIETAHHLLTSLAMDYMGGPRTDLRFLRLSEILGRMSVRLTEAVKEYAALTTPDGPA